MAQRLYFAFQRKTSGDATRVVDDPIGNFSCLYNTAKFLDIEKLAKPFLKTTERKKSKERTLNRATGTVNRSLKNSDNKAEDSQIPGSLSKGTRRVVLVTGKKIDARNTVNATYHTISFRFPAIATIVTIADALGTIIPPGKFGAIPSASQVSPLFKVVGGRRYPIMSMAAAESSTAAIVILTAAQAKQLGGEDVEIYPGFGS